MASLYMRDQLIITQLRRMIVVVLCGLVFMTPAPAKAEPVTGREYAVKLGFIYNFIRFTTWPKTAFKKDPKTMTMCIASDNASSENLYRLDGKDLKKRKLKVIAYQQDSCMTQGHILFFATQNKDFIRQVLDQTLGQKILTIGEIENFTSSGGIINLFQKAGRMGFRVNIDEAQRNGLKLSSQLLQSADEIVKGLYEPEKSEPEKEAEAKEEKK